MVSNMEVTNLSCSQQLGQVIVGHLIHKIYMPQSLKEPKSRLSSSGLQAHTCIYEYLYLMTNNPCQVLES